MKFLLLSFFIFTSAFSQKLLIANTGSFLGVDIYENCYHIKQGVLHKTGTNDFEFKSVTYGKPDIVDISAPFQIFLFYKNFNKVVVLDNRLNFIEDFDVPFGTGLISNASTDKIWLYNNINKTIALFNFKTQKTEVNSLPIRDEIIQLKGNLNVAKAITREKELVTFNYIAREVNRKNIQKRIHSLSLIHDYFIENNQLKKDNTTITNQLPQGIESFAISHEKIYYTVGKQILSMPIPKN